MSILHPVAASPEAALNAPLGRAARAREAEALAGAPVEFVVAVTGPAFATREAALDAYVGRLEDDRPGRRAVAPEDRFCGLREMIDAADRRPARPLQPANVDGRRWPEPPAPPQTLWRLSVAFWRVASPESLAEADLDQARRLRRAARAAALDARALGRLSRQPLQPVRPQQPLDLGLFETRLPEAPHIIVPDE